MNPTKDPRYNSRGSYFGIAKRRSSMHMRKDQRENLIHKEMSRFKANNLDETQSKANNPEVHSKNKEDMSNNNNFQAKRNSKGLSGFGVLKKDHGGLYNSQVHQIQRKSILQKEIYQVRSSHNNVYYEKVWGKGGRRASGLKQGIFGNTESRKSRFVLSKGEAVSAKDGEPGDQVQNATQQQKSNGEQGRSAELEAKSPDRPAETKENLKKTRNSKILKPFSEDQQKNRLKERIQEKEKELAKLMEAGREKKRKKEKKKLRELEQELAQEKERQRRSLLKEKQKELELQKERQLEISREEERKAKINEKRKQLEKSILRNIEKHSEELAIESNQENVAKISQVTKTRESKIGLKDLVRRKSKKRGEVVDKKGVMQQVFKKELWGSDYKPKRSVYFKRQSQSSLEQPPPQEIINNYSFSSPFNIQI